jgi:hypothetical protein
MIHNHWGEVLGMFWICTMHYGAIEEHNFLTLLILMNLTWLVAATLSCAALDLKYKS